MSSSSFWKRRDDDDNKNPRKEALEAEVESLRLQVHVLQQELAVAHGGGGSSSASAAAATAPRKKMDTMSAEVVASNPYSRLMALKRMGK